MGNLMERLDNLRELIQEPGFLEGKGLSNEVNIRIFSIRDTRPLIPVKVWK